MMKYDRLTFRHKSVVDGTEQIGYTERLAGCYRKEDMIFNRLAELEDKIEQGTLKEFNDNLIGETVYGIQQDTTGKYYFENDEHTLLGFTSNGIVVWNDFYGYTDYFTDGFWFLNYEEAEKKFKELQNG